jgi:membrane dipeptidase
VIERGGVIGASMDTWMLCPEQVIDWGKTSTFNRRDVFTRESITLGTLANHIDHVCQLAGNANHAAIGGDTDGQGGLDGAPHEIDTVADYQRLGPILSERGYSDADVAKIMYQNWQRFYEEHLPAT